MRASCAWRSDSTFESPPASFSKNVLMMADESVSGICHSVATTDCAPGQLKSLSQAGDALAVVNLS